MQLLTGDALEMLRTLADGSVHACVTSPPYFALRDYGTATWVGGDPACGHQSRSNAASVRASTLQGGKATVGHQQAGAPGATCPLCGARRVDQQIGLEDTPEAFVARLVEVFREVKRVLRDDGVLMVNIGDTYASGGRCGGGSYGPEVRGWQHRDGATGWRSPTAGLKHKDLIGVPWMLAFALRADGWHLRQDIIWHKPSPMPESVRDRCTKAHEYVFLLSKGPRYFWDADAIAEPAGERGWGGSTFDEGKTGIVQGKAHLPGNKTHRLAARYAAGAAEHRTTVGFVRYAGRVRAQYARALELAEQHGLTEAHLEALRAVGLSDAGRGKLLQAGSGRNLPETQRLADEAKAALGGYAREFLHGATRNARSVWTIAATPYKDAHFAVMPLTLAERCVLATCPEGGTVLDPFMGAATVGVAALGNGREFVGIDLNPRYVALSRRRLARVQPPLRFAVGAGS